MFQRLALSSLLVTTMALGPRGVKMIDLNEEAAGRGVTVTLGQQVRVMLRETSGTGYRWRSGAGCMGLLQMDGEHMQAAGTMPGASGSRIWVYSAKSEGSCELRFESGRSWEKTATGKTISFPVTVKKAG